MNPQYQASTLCGADMSPLMLLFVKEKPTEENRTEKKDPYEFV